MAANPAPNPKKRSRASAIIHMKDLSDVPDPYAGLPDDKVNWPKYIGADNKLPGQEGVASTYLPFDADLRGITAHDVEAQVPAYRNLSAAIIGLILSIGYDLKLAAKYWGCNFEEIKGSSSGVRTDQTMWGHPGVNFSGALYVVIDLPLCKAEEARSIIEKNGFAFLESGALVLRSREAARKNSFLQKFGLRSSAAQGSELNAATPHPPTSALSLSDKVNQGGGIAGAKVATCSSMQQRIRQLEAENKALQDGGVDNAAIEPLENRIQQLEDENVQLKNGDANNATTSSLQNRIQQLEDENMALRNSGADESTSNGRAKKHTKATLQKQVSAIEAENEDYKKDVIHYRAALTEAATLFVESIEGDENYDTNTILDGVVHVIFGKRGEDRLFRKGDNLDKAIKDLEELDTTKDKEG